MIGRKMLQQDASSARSQKILSVTLLQQNKRIVKKNMLLQHDASSARDKFKQATDGMIVLMMG